ncbi:hypothetical protein CSUB01_01299 [Colletotrichum sublineola]|uniref:Transcription factor CBF/NF-Y/archaeal histone domain-containing protein n=1 Tax=Colletotrichum sublineola TaxID=1173701 RepID=A0A066XEL0_COLSU|nr:hypothetical protein CSUB01_01299 [Colletotrichum sublineola]
MAPGQKAYPRGTVKKIIKAHSNCNLSKNVDVMIYLDYVLFMQTLVKEAAIESKKSGERGITARSVKKVTSGLNAEPSDERSNTVRNVLPRYLGPAFSVHRPLNSAHAASITGKEMEPEPKAYDLEGVVLLASRNNGANGLIRVEKGGSSEQCQTSVVRHWGAYKAVNGINSAVCRPVCCRSRANAVDRTTVR